MKQTAIKHALITALLLAPLVPQALQAADAPPPKRNVVFLLADDLRPDCLRKFGHLAVPNRSGRMLTLSSPALSGSFAPTISAQVAMRSLRQMVSSHTEPALILPGQRATNGSRCPPS
jgi:hypothetical protein